jgi:hypothetical protein
MFLNAAHAQNGELPSRPTTASPSPSAASPTTRSPQISKVYTISDNGTVNLLTSAKFVPQAQALHASAHHRADLRRSREIYTRPTVTVSTDDSAATARMVYVISGCCQKRPHPVEFRHDHPQSRRCCRRWTKLHAHRGQSQAKPSKTKLIRDGVITTEINLKDHQRQ